MVHLALALEGTAVRVLFDLAPMEQRDLQALIRALEMRFGQQTFMAHFHRRVRFGSVRLSPVVRGRGSPAQFRGRIITADSTLMVGRMSIAAAATLTS